MRTKNPKLIKDIRKFIAAYYQEHLETPRMEKSKCSVKNADSSV